MPQGHLTNREREIIGLWHELKRSQSAIARRIGRSQSTISRELKRNSSHGFYLPQVALEKAQQRRKDAKAPWKMNDKRLRKYVINRLRCHWSPELIAGRLRREFPNRPQWHLAAGTIYRWLERERIAGGKLWKLLPRQQGRKYRRRRKINHQNLQSRIIGRVGIEQRPPVVDKRSRLGDWEGDTMYGKRNSTSLLTQLERKSRYLLAVKVDDRSAPTMQQAMQHLFRKTPRAARRTITLDNGREFANCPQMEESLGLAVYFADPYAAWQRGANENANGLIRRYFPKGTDFRQVSAEQLAHAVQQINHRPRKCLNFQSPHEVFWKMVQKMRQ